MQQKSEVQVYWEAICAKSQVDAPWENLSPMDQMQLVQSINLLLNVLNKHS